MADGISPNKLNDLSKIYLDQIHTFREIRKQENLDNIERWQQPVNQPMDVTVEEEKKALPKLKMYRKAGNLARAGDEKSMKRQTKMVSVLNKETEEGHKKAALDKLRDGGSPKHQSEAFSDWRGELREISLKGSSPFDDSPMTDVESEKKVKEKKVKNKVEINPKLPEAVEQIGGELIEVTEYDPIEDAIEYLYEEGINEEGIDLLIEEIGLDGFVEFVEGGAIELNEERKARRANVKAKSYADVKAEIDKKDAAKKKAKKGEYSPSYAKKETDVTVYDKAPAKKKAAAKKTVKAVKKTATTKGGAIVKAQPSAIVKAVSKVKKTQPVKKATKQGLGSKIRSAYKKGVERHKASVGKAKTEVGKVVKTAKATAKQHSQHRKDFVSGISPTAKEKKIAKGVGGAVKKALTREELELLEKVKGQDVETRKAMAAERRSGERISKKEAPSRTKNYVARTKQSIKWHDKRTKGRYAPGEITDTNEEVGISSAAAIEKAKKEAKLQKKEAEAVKKVKKEEYTVTAADQKGNTPAWQAYKAKKKNVKTGKPLYKAADHVKEDKAFQNVVAALRKKHGEEGVLTKDSPKPKSKPLDAKQIWRKDDRSAVQREVDAQYGRTPWNKKGSLGT